MISSKTGLPDRIFLIGFMGSGKTFHGKQLAAQIGWKFLDLDEKIEARAGSPIAQIFEKNGGEPAFRKLELEALRETFLLDKTVVATGGGTPCFFENMDEMRKNGLVIYLKTSQSLLFERLVGEKPNRPLIAGMLAGQLRAFIKNKVSEREGFYLRADLTIRQGKNRTGFLGEMLKKWPNLDRKNP